jgi:hypothetical protein
MVVINLSDRENSHLLAQSERRKSLTCGAGKSIWLGGYL